MTPTKHQTEVINSDERHITVAAGPGSGKTTTLIQRILRLVKDGCPASWIVAITFTNAAAREIEKRLKAHDESIKLGYAGTLHGFLLRLIQKHAHLVHYMPGITILDEAERQKMIETLISEHRWKGSASAVVEDIKRGPHVESSSALQIITKDFYQRLQRGNMMDFDAILFYGLALIKKIPVSDLPYRHLFVDEFQDSGSLDAQIYEALPMTHKLFVGDPDQSIYKFRGARPEIMQGMFASDKGLKVVLAENFRSDGQICEAANSLIAHNDGRFNKKTEPMSDRAGSLSFVELNSPIQEMHHIAAQIQKCWISTDENPGGRFAVLCRSNAMAREIASYLEAVGLPVVRKVKQQWPDDWQTCRALLSLLTNPDNDELAYRWISLAIGKEKADSLKKQAASAFTSMNEIGFHFAPKVSLFILPHMMAETRLSDASIELVKRGIAKLDNAASASVSELMYCLTLDETVEHEAGHGVTVTTIHGAKGREWDNVILPGFEEGMMPLTGKDNDIEEERRIAFVGITRARHNLLVTSCQRRKRQWIKEDDATPSRFIEEMKGAAA